MTCHYPVRSGRLGWLRWVLSYCPLAKCRHMVTENRISATLRALTIVTVVCVVRNCSADTAVRESRQDMLRLDLHLIQGMYLRSLQQHSTPARDLLPVVDIFSSSSVSLKGSYDPHLSIVDLCTLMLASPTSNLSIPVLCRPAAVSHPSRIANPPMGEYNG